MLKVVSTERIRQIEAAADAQGITFDTMFQRVGSIVTHYIHDLLASVPKPRVTILVGGGNNGGDGLVVARMLADQGDIDIGVYLVKPRPEDDAKLAAIQGTDIFIASADHDQQFRVLRNMVASADLVVDAILGIGTRLPLEDNVAKILRNVNQALNFTPPPSEEGILIEPDEIGFPTPSPATPIVLALDCPSGIDCDTGETDSAALTADETITFIAVKHGLLRSPAIDHVGKLSVATLGIPDNLDELKSESVIYADQSLIRSWLPQRTASSHKGTHGKAFIVAGSANYTGAAGLASQAAYRSGAGLVTLAAPMPVISVIAAQSLETTWIMLPHDMGVISEKAVDVITKEIGKYDALLIGPGISQEDTTGDMLIKLLTETQDQPTRRESRPIGFAGLRQSQHSDSSKDEPEAVTLPPIVLDADALNLLAKHDNWHELIPANTILTPHPGEMARLCKLEIDEVESNRIALAQEKAAAWKAVVLLKGAHTVIAAPDGRTTILPFKTAALATAGTGDILAGIIVSLLAQKIEPYESAVIGGYLHGSAGIIAERFIGSSHGVIASDVLNLVGDILGDLD